jgi:alpha-D-ribose 1-methylphosphonate 5-triphosphate synthase subunit PhnG
MDRTTRCEHLARLTDPELAELATLLAHRPDDVTVINGPTIGMIMARVVEDARNEIFNLGEILVTECHVQLGDDEGWAMLMGSRPTAALQAATIDAALAADPAAVQAVESRLLEFVAGHDAILAAQRAELAPTRVQFETQ